MVFLPEHNSFLKYLDKINILQNPIICALANTMAPPLQSELDVISADHLAMIREDTMESAHKF